MRIEDLIISEDMSVLQAMQQLNEKLNAIPTQTVEADSEKTEKKEKAHEIKKQSTDGLDSDCAAVYALFGEESLHPDEISAATGFPLSKVISLLMQLQMDDYIEIDGGKNYRLK